MRYLHIYMRHFIDQSISISLNFYSHEINREYQLINDASIFYNILIYTFITFIHIDDLLITRFQ